MIQGLTLPPFFRTAGAHAIPAGTGNFDSVARLAARLFDAPSALVTLVERERIRLLGTCGLDVGELPRESGFCATAVLRDEPLVIESADSDVRTMRHSLVAAPHNVRFYAGAVLRGADGSRLGTVCVMDRIARRADPEALELLVGLAELAVDRLERRADALKAKAAAARPPVEALDLDALTALPGRRAFDEELERLGDSREAAASLGAVITVYIERLRSINERRGRELGDQLLRAAGGALQGVLGSGARLFRTGGCEFAILLDPTAARELGAIKAKVDGVMQTLRVIGFHEAFACVGAAETSEVDGPASAFRLADWRMYGEKMARPQH